jgi:hypothetical protein
MDVGVCALTGLAALIEKVSRVEASSKTTTKAVYSKFNLNISLAIICKKRMLQS